MGMTISGSSGVTFPDSTTMTSGNQACKAWVNFNGTGTVAIRGSFNVSSITDRGTGDYTVNFTNAMPDAYYSQCWTAGSGAGTGAYYYANIFVTPTASGCGARIVADTNVIADAAYVNVAVFR